MAIRSSSRRRSASVAAIFAVLAGGLPSAMGHSSAAVTGVAESQGGGRVEDQQITATVFQGRAVDQVRAAVKSGTKLPTGRQVDQTVESVRARVKATRPPMRYLPVSLARRPATRYAPAAVALPDPLLSRVTTEECFSNSQATNSGGWVKNRFSYCERWAFQIIISEHGAPIGDLIGEVMHIVNTSSGDVALSQQFWRFTLLRATGSAQERPEDYVIQNRLLAVANRSGVPSACGADRWVGRWTTLPNWFANSTATWTTTPPATGSGRDNFTSCSFVPYFRFWKDGNPGVYIDVAPYFGTTGGGTQYRNGQDMACSSVTYLNYLRISRPKGCAFTTVIGTLPFSWSNTNQYGAIRHIWLAYFDPASTYPQWAGKTIPGYISQNPGDRSEDLRRNYYDTTTINRSRTIVAGICNQVWPGYAQNGYQCDEVPFASTYSSAGTGTARFSARAVIAAENGAAGNWMSHWFVLDRVIHWEAPFRVIIVQ